jgi:hypothetical protein
MEVNIMNTRTLSILLIGFALLAGCASPTTSAPPAQSQFATVTPTLFITTGTPAVLTASQPPGAFTAIPNLASTPASGMSNVCTDPQVTALFGSLKTAVLTSDGLLLSSLVHPTRGLDVAYFRDGNVINYDQEHAKFVFETTFEVNWGTEPGSGAGKIGSFHNVVVPELVKAFNQPYTLLCNELKHGGATYELEWPYEGDFYSVYFPGTEANGLLDWHTWVVGVQYVNNKPFIYALMQFFWEP